MNIAEILTQQESKTLEFKRDLSSLKPIMKTLVAFANTAGGLLVIGKESNGEIVGVEDVDNMNAEDTVNASNDPVNDPVNVPVNDCQA